LEIFIFAVLLGLIPAMIAKSKGRSFALWWLYGAMLLIIALPHSLILSVDKKTIEQKLVAEGNKKCPYCAELIKDEAIFCRFCKKELQLTDSKIEQEDNVSGLSNENPNHNNKRTRWAYSLILPTVVLIAYLIVGGFLKLGY